MSKSHSYDRRDSRKPGIGADCLPQKKKKKKNPDSQMAGMLVTSFDMVHSDLRFGHLQTHFEFLIRLLHVVPSLKFTFGTALLTSRIYNYVLSQFRAQIN